ncbi:MAG: VPA1262 family N-terminal domain-containing protein [Candidatus Symbiobacter sp.]|nr:VPA1262 family N-terminal domain-containing protein [Candidatus Symbiobacter sp.]
MEQHYSPGHKTIKHLIQPDVLGFYTHFEITEIFACRKGISPINVLTVMVAEEEPQIINDRYKYLNKLPIKLKSLSDWVFGIKQYYVTLDQGLGAVEKITDSNYWQLSGEALNFTSLIAVPKQFVPPDMHPPLALNKLLKNNFWNGSYVVEYFDRSKSNFDMLLQKPSLLQSLSGEIQKYLPIELASVSDRLGNILVQIPANIVIYNIYACNSYNLPLDLNFHPKASYRHLWGLCETCEDDVISTNEMRLISDAKIKQPFLRQEHNPIVKIWDQKNNLLQAATSKLAFIRSINSKLMIAMESKRIPKRELIYSIDGKEQQNNVKFPHINETHTHSQNLPEKYGANWINDRIYQSERKDLSDLREFVQYKPKSHEVPESHIKALEDIIWLINQHGEKAAWLWDPYLSANDLMATLLQNRHENAELRAICGQGINDTANQGYQLNQGIINPYGLKFEYRHAKGKGILNFHDRFLIFPSENARANVWSLGASVNSVGKSHHILHKVSHGQMIMDAFVELWDQLSDSQYLIWRYPK